MKKLDIEGTLSLWHGEKAINAAIAKLFPIHVWNAAWKLFSDLNAPEIYEELWIELYCE